MKFLGSLIVLLFLIILVLWLIKIETDETKERNKRLYDIQERYEGMLSQYKSLSVKQANRIAVLSKTKTQLWLCEQKIMEINRGVYEDMGKRRNCFLSKMQRATIKN